MEYIDRHFVDRARRVVAEDQAAVQLRRDLHCIALRTAQAPNTWLQRWNQAAARVAARVEQLEEGRVRSTPADPAGQGGFSKE